MAYYDDYGYPRYVSVGEKKARARRKLEQLKKKHPGTRPVVIEGNTLVCTWWGKAWNGNLTKYADYSNRVGRGRSYVRHGAVLDLQIGPGQVDALVQGSRATPYKISVAIKPIRRATWKDIRTACEGQVASLQELLEGRFPKALADLFTAKGTGLFPLPREITFRCSCPDWAYMCKHVAAVLYGIGTRLDKDPSLFFVLRKAKMDDLVTQAVRDKSARLLKQATKKTSRVIDDNDLGDVFGIEMEAAGAQENDRSEVAIIAPETAAKPQRKAPLKKTRKKRTSRKAKASVKKMKK